jgi:DNA topoisomerase-3
MGRKKQAEQIQKSIEREGRAVVEDVSIKTVQEQSPYFSTSRNYRKKPTENWGFLLMRFYKQPKASMKNNSSLIPEPAANIFLKMYGLKFLSWSEYSIKPIIQSSHNPLKFGNFNKRIVNDLKVTDHHGLLITTKTPSALSATEKAIYEMIAYRLLESYPTPV